MWRCPRSEILNYVRATVDRTGEILTTSRGVYRVIMTHYSSHRSVVIITVIDLLRTRKALNAQSLYGGYFYIFFLISLLRSHDDGPGEEYLYTL